MLLRRRQVGVAIRVEGSLAIGGGTTVRVWIKPPLSIRDKFRAGLQRQKKTGKQRDVILYRRPSIT